jgi:hypothetical protein
MSWIPSHLTIRDVSTLFISRVPQFLSDVEKDHSLVLVVTRNEFNTDFLSNIHPTDHTFYFYKDKYMSLPIHYESVYEPEELLNTGILFFQ